MNELIIDKNDLLHNIEIIKNNNTDENYTIIAVVKANAYGMGLDSVKILKQQGIEYFAVSKYVEVLDFRKEYSDKLLLLTPYYDEEILSNLIDKDVILTIDSIKQAMLIDKIAKEKDVKVYAHIKVDTGLNRYGIKYNDVNSIINIVNNTENIKYYGIYSHFSNSLAKDEKFTKLQYDRFIKVIDELQEKGIDFKLKHICNSSAYFKYPEMHLNAARIGSAFIGVASNNNNLKKIGIFHTKVVKVQDVLPGDFIGYAKSYKVKTSMNIAILNTGYFDGVGKTLIDQRFSFKSRLKGVYEYTKYLFKTDYVYLDDLKVLGQIGMHDIVIDNTDKKLNINDDVYFYYNPADIPRCHSER